MSLHDKLDALKAKLKTEMAPRHCVDGLLLAGSTTPFSLRIFEYRRIDFDSSRNRTKLRSRRFSFEIKSANF